MSKKDFSPQRPKAKPTIYALPNDTSRKDQLKIGFTTRSAHERIEEQIGATRAKYEIVLIEPAIRNDGASFTDRDIHKYLRKIDLETGLEKDFSALFQACRSKCVGRRFANEM